MGIHDRDYMKDEKPPPKRGAEALPFLVLVILATFIGMFLSLRIPLPPLLRIAFAGCILLLGATQIARRI